MKALAVIDKFYYILGVVLLAMSIVVILTARTIFSALEIAGEVNEELLQASTPRINRIKMEQALKIMDESKVVLLDL